MRYIYTTTPSTSSNTSSKPNMGVDDGGIGKAEMGKNVHVVMPRHRLIPKTQAEPTPNGGMALRHGLRHQLFLVAVD